MVDVQETLIDKELERVETEINEEENSNKDKIEQNTADLTDFKPYINYLHQLGFKMARIEVDELLLDELNSNLLKIIEKRLPSLTNVAGNSPELAYLSVLGLILMTSKKQQETTNKEQKGVIVDVK